MVLSLVSGIRDKMKKGKNTGLFFFAVALLMVLTLMIYGIVKNGSPV